MATIFPHLTSTGAAPTYREVVHRYRETFARRVEQGTLRPLVLPYHLYGILFLAAYLCIPHTQRPWVYSARWAVLVVMIGWQWKTISDASSMSFATAFAVGLTAAWGIVWTATWLVWCRPQFDAKRVQRRKVARGEAQALGSNSNAASYNGGAVGNGSIVPKEYSSLRLRTKSNGRTSREEGQIITHGRANGTLSNVSADSKESEEWEYYWQSYPDNLIERIPWVLDLLMNFRGPGWNWAIPPLPALNPSLKTKLGEPIDPASRSNISSVGLKRFNNRRELINYRMPQFVAGYFILDALKTMMMKDPYFIFGPTTYALPSYLQSLSPVTLILYRQVLSSLAIITSLEMVFILGSLIFSLILGPSLLGLRAEVWYYPSTWGSFDRILDKGLNGLWGSWWHQTFRFAFSAPTNWAIRNGYVGAKDMKARVLGLVCAFGISGFLHSGGSISQLPKTYPWHAPVFFILQAVGIVFQMTIASALHPTIRKFPKSLRQAGNFAFAWAWLYYTSWLLIDDFARGGIWLYEPLPISPLRAMGFGVKGDWWWCWKHVGVGWYTGKHWWESGIAI